MPSFWSVFFALLFARQTLIFLMMSASSLGVLFRRKRTVEALFVADRPVTAALRREAGLATLLAEGCQLVAAVACRVGAEHLSLDPTATHWAERARLPILC